MAQDNEKKLDKMLKENEKKLFEKINNAKKLNSAGKNWAKQLVNSHQIILTGAPGTGKTYAAEKIAKVLTGEKEITGEKDCCVELVQFHPSMDYTDFMEGLRPIKDDNGNTDFEHKDYYKGNIDFERQDGIFKAFCAKAATNWNNATKPSEERKLSKSLESLFREFIQQHGRDTTLQRINKTWRYNKEGKNVYIDAYIDEEGNNINTEAYVTTKTTENNISKEEYESTEQSNITLPVDGEKRLIIKTSSNKISKIINTVLNCITSSSFSEDDIYDFVEKKFWGDKADIFPICKNFLSSDGCKTAINSYANSKNKNGNDGSDNSLKYYVFIIDEINRGNIAKIFGELFYAIDPSYRGKDGRVKTQYQNLVTDEPFDNGFYIPENVYIIGTMNDIDRGVESMDFAIRRRFTWIEVDPDDTADSILGSLKGSKTQAKTRMKNLNMEISQNPSLGPAYQIGAAYFMKLPELKEVTENDENEFDALWKYHLEPLLREYLRGEADIKGKLEKLKTAYNKEAKTGKKPSKQNTTKKNKTKDALSQPNDASNNKTEN